MNREEKNALQATFKSQDTEEWLDIHFTRPLGLLWAKFFRALGIHPNVVTILSIFLGAGAGVCFFYPVLWINVIGIGLLVWANLYDSADGQLARMTGQKTRWGRILDGFAGDVWFVMIYLAIVFRMFLEWGLTGGIVGFFLCWVAGVFFHAKQSQLADYYRNIHLFFLKGEAGAELDNYPKLRAEFISLSWKKDFFWKLFLHSYMHYTRAQEKMTPCFQSFRKHLQQRYPEGELPEALRQEFRTGSRPLMPAANFLTFNARAITLYVSILLGVLWVYPVMEITLFSWVFYRMRRRHEALCRRLQEKY